MVFWNLIKANEEILNTSHRILCFSLSCSLEGGLGPIDRINYWVSMGTVGYFLPQPHSGDQRGEQLRLPHRPSSKAPPLASLSPCPSRRCHRPTTTDLSTWPRGQTGPLQESKCQIMTSPDDLLPMCVTNRGNNTCFHPSTTFTAYTPTP